MAGLDKVIEMLLHFIDSFWVMCVIDHREGAVMMRLGRFNRLLAPGPHFRLPFQIDTIKRTVVKRRTDDLVAQSLTTKDGRAVTLSVCITYSIVDTKYVLLEVDDLDGIIRDSSIGCVGEFVGDLDYEELRGVASHYKLTRAVKKQLAEFGIDLHRIQVAEFVEAHQVRLWNGM